MTDGNVVFHEVDEQGIHELGAVVRHAVLEDGKEYPLHGSADTVFKCLWHSEMGDYALVERISETAPYRMYIHNVTLYPDGSITWQYGGGGRFADEQ